jgi:cytochrome c biogenesis protein CcmG, thiol:disulfide interchange protein DsbE
MSQMTTDSPPVSPPKGWQQRIRESRLGTVLVLAVTAAIVMGGAYLVDRPKTATATATTAANGTTATNVVAGDGPAPKIGSPAQDFTATTVDGKQVSLSSYKGQSVWLTFGASWCAACVSEAPDIQSSYQKFKAKGVVVLGIFISEDSATVKDYADRVGLTYPKVADPDSSIASEYRVYGIPAHFFIDKSGVLRSTKTGGLSTEQMDTALTEISR